VVKLEYLCMGLHLTGEVRVDIHRDVAITVILFGP